MADHKALRKMLVRDLGEALAECIRKKASKGGTMITSDCTNLQELRLFAAFAISKLRWRHNGLGLLQAYIHEGNGRELRLHVWDPSLVRLGILGHGNAHDHRFEMQSTVLLGKLFHTEYQERQRRKGRPMTKYKRAVAIDFDGVIHPNTRWEGVDATPDAPTPGAKEAISSYLAHGFDVVVFSCRATEIDGRLAIARYLAEHFGLGATEGIKITAEKPHAAIYIDDRGYCFQGTFPSVADISEFRPWNRK